MATSDLECEARYERNCPVAPKWEDLGQVTRSAWLEETEALRPGAAVAPAQPVAPTSAPIQGGLF